MRPACRQRPGLLPRLWALGGLLLCCGCVAGAVSPEEGKQRHRVYQTKGYRYLPGPPAGDAEVGHALCGTRCNALATDSVTYTEPGGWSLTKVASDREIRLPLDNPFLGGECLCLVDEYLAEIDTLNCPHGWAPPRR